MSKIRLTMMGFMNAQTIILPQEIEEYLERMKRLERIQDWIKQLKEYRKVEGGEPHD